MDDEDELLPPGRPLLPRRLRIAVLIVAVVVLAALVLVKVWPNSTPGSIVVAVLYNVIVVRHNHTYFATTCDAKACELRDR